VLLPVPRVGFGAVVYETGYAVVPPPWPLTVDHRWQYLALDIPTLLRHHTPAGAAAASALICEGLNRQKSLPRVQSPVYLYHSEMIDFLDYVFFSSISVEASFAHLISDYVISPSNIAAVFFFQTAAFSSPVFPGSQHRRPGIAQPAPMFRGVRGAQFFARSHPAAFSDENYKTTQLGSFLYASKSRNSNP